MSDDITTNLTKSEASTVEAPVSQAQVTEAQPSPDTVLKDLAKQIRGYHAKVQGCLRASVEHAHQAGEALAKAKTMVKDNGGSWRRWLAKNCKLSIRQAQKYVQLAEGFSELVKVGHDTKRLTISEAVRLLANLRGKASGGENAGQPAGDKEEEPYYRLSRADLHIKHQEAKRLQASGQIKFTDDAKEGKFVKEKTAAIVEQIRRMAAKLGGVKKEGGDQVEPIHFAIALIERLGMELHAAAIAEIVEPQAASNGGAAAVTAPEAQTTPTEFKPQEPTMAPAVEPEVPVKPTRRNPNGSHRRNGKAAALAS